ncbi:MAG: serine--tRNA ligase [Fibrobacterota bacterium]
MLDIKFIRDNAEAVKENCRVKKDSADIDGIIELYEKIRSNLHEVEQLKKERNESSKEIGRRKKNGEDAADLINSMQEVSATIKELDSQRSEIEASFRTAMAAVPNMPHESVPSGSSEDDNVVSDSWGEKKTFSFDAQDHLQLAEKLELFDFKRGAKISGSGFPVLTGDGARLNRALINFFLDQHRAKGYREIQPPYMVNSDSAFGTGQLPKSADQMYYMNEDDLYAVPTAEVPLTNLHRDEMLQEKDLPKRMCAYTACFRREAGSYGKDTKGFLRVHQFDKVELVKMVTQENSYDELELLREDAEALLQKLGLPYRILTLCDADLSFAAAKCYDLEVWAPGEEQWLEVSSVSNFEDFQARRMNMRYKPAGGGKTRFVHTLNGSGLATARILVAILENYQNEDGTVTVPEVLRPYMGGQEKIG